MLTFNLTASQVSACFFVSETIPASDNGNAFAVRMLTYLPSSQISCHNKLDGGEHTCLPNEYHKAVIVWLVLVS